MGFHSDAKVIYFNSATASIKLKIIVKELSLEFLKKNPESIATVKKAGIAAIWSNIAEEVAERLFEEYGKLSEFLIGGKANKENPEFKTLKKITMCKACCRKLL